MNKLVKTVTPLLLIFILYVLSFAKLMGEGEVTGDVVQSWYSGERVVFSLNISNQKNETGPILGIHNEFVYAGADKAEITEGDAVKLRYNSDDGDGIIVEKLEFIYNKPDSIGQTRNLWLLITLCGVLIGVILVVSGIIYQKRRNRI